MWNKVIFFCGCLQSGGAERVISILSKRFLNKFKNVEIVLYYDRDINYELASDVKVTVIQKEVKKANRINSALWFRKHVKSEKPDVVISFLAPFNIYAILSLFNSGVPIIVADRNNPRYVPGNVIVRKLRDFLYGFADGVVLQTKWNQDYFKGNVKKKSIVIYNPIMMQNHYGEAIDFAKENLIVTVGRLEKQKNQELLISAFSVFHKVHPEYKLEILGEGSYRPELEKCITEVGMQDDIMLPGNVTNVFDRIKGAKAFVLTSHYEGMPNALMEAMCLGLPIISTNIAGVTELIQNNTDGILIDSDAGQLADALEKIVSDDGLARKLSENAAKKRELFDLEEICDKWYNYIGQVIDGIYR